MGWIPPDPDFWKLPFDPEDWLPPAEGEELFGPWGPGGPFGVGPNNPWAPGTDPPAGWGPEGPFYDPPTPPPSGAPVSVVAGGAAETAGVLALAVLPALALLFGGLLLPASAWGRPRWYWPWEDPCDDDFIELSVEVKELYDDATAFAAKPSRKGAMTALSQASFVIRLCQQFLRECPKNAHAGTVRQILAAAEQERDACLDYLATH